MNIPPKYEDVVAELEAALGREAALRESLTDKREEYNKLGDRYDALQHRLTAAEQRAGELREKLAYEESDHHTTQVCRDAWRAKYEDALRVIQEKDLLLNRSKNFVAFVHKCVRKNQEYAPLHWQEMVELDRDLSALKPAAEPHKCIECESQYCHGVCIERGDNDERYKGAEGEGS